MKRIRLFVRQALQRLIILVIQPYTTRELLGWGWIYAAAVGDYRRNWLWENAPIKVVRGKLHGYLMRLDLSKWSDRAAFFLGRWYDLSTQLLIQELVKPGDTVVDVGANRGMFALMASRLVGDQGRVLCFEPNPSCAKLLEDEVATNNIHNIVVFRAALGSKRENSILSVPYINSGEGTFGASTYGDELYQVHCDILQGDETLFAEHLSLIKIDVEGFECNVIEGLRGIIERDRPKIVTEVVPQLLARCGSSEQDLSLLMQGFGYTGLRLSVGKRTRSRNALIVEPYQIGHGACDVLWLHAEISSNSKSIDWDREESDEHPYLLRGGPWKCDPSA